MSDSPRRSRQRQSSSGGQSEWREQIQEQALPVLESWGRGSTLDAVRSRLRGVFGLGLLVILIRFLLDPGGLTGTLITLWFIPSALLATVAGCLLVLLRNPREAPNVWFEQNVPAAIGLIALGWLAEASRRSSAGLTLWRVLFGSEPPLPESRSSESPVDDELVAQYRRYLWFAIAGSAVVIGLEQLLARGTAGFGGSAGSLGLSLSPAEWGLLTVGGAVLGVVVGALLAVTEP